MKNVFEARAQRAMNRINQLGFTKSGNKMVIDQAREVIAAEEGANNWHVLHAQMKATCQKEEGGKTGSDLTPSDLRRKAAEMMQQAQDIDGLRPVIVVHEHEFGTSCHVGWFGTDTPSEKQAAGILPCDFEPERDEYLTIERIQYSELTCPNTINPIDDDNDLEHIDGETSVSPEQQDTKPGNHLLGPFASHVLGWINELAVSHGWAIFDSSGLLEIQRDDEAQVFDSDAAAIVHIAVKAHEKPDGLEARALEFLRTNPNGYVGWANACEIAAKHLAPVKDSNAFMHTDGWTHCFVGSKQSYVRWLFSVHCNKVIYAEINTGYKWVALSTTECEDLTESIVSTEDLPNMIDDFDDVVLGDELPAWLPASVIVSARNT